MHESILGLGSVSAPAAPICHFGTDEKFKSIVPRQHGVTTHLRITTVARGQEDVIIAFGKHTLEY